MRAPSLRNPRSFWDIFAVLCGYVLLEFIVLQLTGSLLVKQELVVIAIAVFVWAAWAVYHVLVRVESAR
jgi:hypothetical protein